MLDQSCPPCPLHGTPNRSSFKQIQTRLVNLPNSFFRHAVASGGAIDAPSDAADMLAPQPPVEPAAR